MMTHDSSLPAGSAHKKRWHFWWLAFRPKTLTAAFVPVLVASALASAHHDRMLIWVSFCALLAAILIQIGTNLANDALDFKKGADTEERLGPQRVTQKGWLNERSVLMGAAMCFGLAILASIPLIWQGGIAISILAIISILLGYAYTGGPFPLAYRGLGDLFVLIFFGIVAVTTTFYLHTGKLWHLGVWIASLQVGCLATVLIAINNLRDVEQDRKANKRTLAVRWGVQAVRWEIFILSYAPFLLGIYWWQTQNWGAFVLPMLSLPLAHQITKAVFLTMPSRQYNNFLAKAALLHLLFGVLLSLGFFLNDDFLRTL